MQKSLMIGLNEKDMAAVIHTYDLKDYYYPTLFPLKETTRLDWKMLEAQAGLKIAADLVSRGSTIPRKTREAISRIQGDIPKITIAREKNEDELTEYDIMVAMSSNNPDLRALVEFWAEDTKFCWDGVAARLEWIALKEISLGKVTFTTSNNAAIVSEYNVDYLVPASNKIGVQTAYSGTSGKPLTVDFPKALKLGKSLYGAKYKFAFMNVETFDRLAAQEEVVKRCATVVENIANTTKGVDKSYAIQAGREIRIIAKPEEVKDDEIALLARDISKRIESELEYPGQIKVNVVRETRAIEYAK